MASKKTPAGRDHKYLAVRTYLAELIADELSVGDAIPSERSLVKRFGVSRMTVRQAIDALVGEGTLVREQGKGTFVAPERADFEMRLTTFGEEVKRRGMAPASKILQARQVTAPPAVAEALGLERNSPMYYLERLRTADGMPMSIEHQWLPVSLVPDLFDDGPPESVYEALREHDLAPTWGEDTIVASEASDDEAVLLEMKGSRAVMRTKRRTFSGNTPIAYGWSCYRGDRYSVFVPLRVPRPTIVPGRHDQPEPPTNKEE